MCHIINKDLLNILTKKQSEESVLLPAQLESKKKVYF